MTDDAAYRVVFDISQQGYAWWFPACGLFAVLIGVVGIWIVRRRPGPYRLRDRGPFLMVGFGVFWTAIAFGMTYSEFRYAHGVYQRGEFYEVEGPVHDFRPMPASGHGDECFAVEDRTFCYSEYVIAAGFNQTQRSGGPIREGLTVRIEYVGGTILRLEVRGFALPQH